MVPHKYLQIQAAITKTSNRNKYAIGNRFTSAIPKEITALSKETTKHENKLQLK